MYGITASFSVPMIQFNANMVEAAYNAGVEWFLYTSSVGVYHPAEYLKEDDVWKTFPSENDWYAGWAKRVGELNVQAYMKNMIGINVQLLDQQMFMAFMIILVSGLW